MKEELSNYEKKIFGRLKREEQPPADLEKRIVEQLKSDHLITSNTYKMNPIIKWVAASAAAVLLFFTGNYMGKQTIEKQGIDPNRGYMLILHEDDQFKPGDPQEMYQEYGAWMQDTMSKGIAMTGHELKNEADIVDARQHVEHLDENSARKTTGYFILEAESLEVALQVARSNPHIKYGGTIEVKQYMVR
ncbi:MAG TPA: hypothetical protein VKN36_10600 [Eudoraea sp.]|nr:hypothetical protein [Eudoraea sp.]